jgi:Secretion system C-terminal sorting domain
LAIITESAERKRNCMDTSSCIKVGAIGIQEIFNPQEIYLYPNPSIDVVEVTGVSKGLIQIRDLSGRIYFNHHFEFEPIKFSIKNLPSALYLLEIQTGLFKKTMKLIKN